MPEESLNYAQSGVDVEAAARSLRLVEKAVTATYGPQVLSRQGSYGGLFAPDFGGMERPVLVSSIDGVGTKTKVAQMVGSYAGLGHDIVNHCINDILCQGAKPLFFLDYFGCSRLSEKVFEEVVIGAAEACAAQGCALIGGETAEMPGVYEEDEVDIVGCIVGAVDQKEQLPRGFMKSGDKLIGLASNGLHTNGFSLARAALLGAAQLSVRDPMPHGATTIGEELLKPHRCYFSSVFPLLAEFPDIYALAHITGGGFYDNIPRVLQQDIKVMIDRRAWTVPPIFSMIQSAGNIPDHDMYRTFNMGIGMVLIVDKDIAPTLVQRLREAGEHAEVIGELQSGSPEVIVS